MTVLRYKIQNTLWIALIAVILHFFYFDIRIYFNILSALKA